MRQSFFVLHMDTIYGRIKARNGGDNMDRKEKAMAYFEEGYNCAQAVTLAFSDLVPVEEKTLRRLSSSFGGGFGRLREVCGAVSGMCIIAGLLYGYDDAKAKEEKAAHYAKIQALANRFKAQNGAMVCRELLPPEDAVNTSPVPSERTGQYYHKRSCKELVGSAAGILEQFIKEQNITK